MYDKIKLWVNKFNDTPDISQFLDAPKEQTDMVTGEIRTFGSKSGLKVSIYTGGISIIGSISRVLYPNNIYSVDRHTTADAIEKLSDELHLNLKNAKITGFEFGTQYAVSKNVSLYLDCLGYMPYLQRVQLSDISLRYQPKSRKQIKVYKTEYAHPLSRVNSVIKTSENTPKTF